MSTSASLQFTLVTVFVSASSLQHVVCICGCWIATLSVELLHPMLCLRMPVSAGEMLATGCSRSGSVAFYLSFHGVVLQRES
jgi:hypothetical protein